MQAGHRQMTVVISAVLDAGRPPFSTEGSPHSNNGRAFHDRRADGAIVPTGAVSNLGSPDQPRG